MHLPAQCLRSGLRPGERKCTYLYEFTDNHDYDYTIPAEGRSLLASLPGRKLGSIEGYRFDLTPAEEKVTFCAVARLHMEDGESYDLRVRPVRVDIAADLWDDAGAHSFGRSEGNIWLPEGGLALQAPHRSQDRWRVPRQRLRCADARRWGKRARSPSPRPRFFAPGWNTSPFPWIATQRRGRCRWPPRPGGDEYWQNNTENGIVLPV